MEYCQNVLKIVKNKTYQTQQQYCSCSHKIIRCTWLQSCNRKWCQLWSLHKMKLIGPLDKPMHVAKVLTLIFLIVNVSPTGFVQTKMPPCFKLPRTKAKYTEGPFWTKLECTEGPFWLSKAVWADEPFWLWTISDGQTLAKAEGLKEPTTTTIPYSAF